LTGHSAALSADVNAFSTAFAISALIRLFLQQLMGMPLKLLLVQLIEMILGMRKPIQLEMLVMLGRLHIQLMFVKLVMPGMRLFQPLLGITLVMLLLQLMLEMKLELFQKLRLEILVQLMIMEMILIQMMGILLVQFLFQLIMSMLVRLLTLGMPRMTHGLVF